ncbi:MAG: HAD family hydrolase [Prevotellaceae bacterium]|nr:HAD family hydrolase [Prevotellaceae bacterium]
MKKYKLIVFDFDGTLADTAECIVQTTKATLRKLGLKERTEAEIRNVIGLPLGQCFSTMFPDGTKELFDKCCDVYRELFYSYQETTIRLFPEVKETLRRLVDDGVKVSIATSRGSQSLGYLCQMLQIDDCVGMKMSADLVAEAKPAPDMVNKILEHYGISPADTLVVGDTIYDIEMGQRADCDTCGVTYGNQTRQQLQEQKPTYIIDNFGDLLRHV